LGFRAFSSEVDTGSREENASNKEIEPPFRFNRNGKGSSPPDYRVPFAFDSDGEAAANPGLASGAAGEGGFAALTTGAGFGGVGFTWLAEEIGFAGPPIEFGFAGPPIEFCFLTPPMAFWAAAGRQHALPNAAAIRIIASAPFFMGPSPDVLTQTIRYAACTSYTNYAANDCRQIETPPDAERSDGDRGMTPPPSSVIRQANHPRAGRASRDLIALDFRRRCDPSRKGHLKAGSVALLLGAPAPPCRER
jgi:hypothetical protein